MPLANRQRVLAALGFGGIATLLAVLIPLAYGGGSSASYAFDPAFAPWVAGYTSGEISRQSPIRVHFTFDAVDSARIGAELKENPFRFRPRIAGKARWEDSRTLAFVPAEALPSGRAFRAQLDVSGILQGVEQKDFRFRFATRPQGARVSLRGVRTLEGEQEALLQTVSGAVELADYESPGKVEQMLSARLGGKRLSIRWEHGEGNQHLFYIDSLRQDEAAQLLRINWDGRAVQLDEKGFEELPIPPVNAFALLHSHAYSRPEPYVTLDFSAPLDPDQDLEGLIRLGTARLKFSIEGNRIMVFPQQRLSGQARLVIERGIRSAEGKLFQTAQEQLLAFSDVQPEVRYIGKGNILPRGNSVPLVFEAVGLKAVDVRVFKVFEKNIPQFFQVNQLDDRNEMQRVGQIVAKKTLRLDAASGLDLTQWNRHSLDLSSLIQSEPGAIYEVAIGFKKSYALCNCSEEELAQPEADMLAMEESWYLYSGNEGYAGYYYDYYEYYDYDEEENPCDNSYYRTSRIARRNVLASDLGIIAKGSDRGSIFFVNDLKTAQPLEGVKLEFYDYQHQLISTLTTAKNGQAEAKFARKPYLLIAKQGEQRGYLRLDDGSALAMSRFDVKGQEYTAGVKGFLYGERDVWRPGDPMYLTFLLEDKGKTLPAGHPVSFELQDSRGQTVEKITQTQGLNQFYSFHTQTAADAPTGNYLAKVRVGGSLFTQRLRVETIMPNRLKMELTFNTPALSAALSSSMATLKSQWLHGATARSLKADVRVTLREAETKFARYPDFRFDDLARNLDTEEKTIFEGKLDESGKVSFPVKLAAENEAPGMLNASFVTRVYEPGGAFSIDRFVTPYHPYSVYAGIRTPKTARPWEWLKTDEDHTVQFVTVDPNGAPVSSTLSVKVYKLGWSWWWDYQRASVPYYQGEVNADVVGEGTVRTSNGVGSWSFKIKYPEWGRYLIRAVDAKGHATSEIVYVDWPAFGGRASAGEREGLTMLSFSADKDKYQVGETVALSIPTGFAGRALVSIESGSRVIQTQWIEATAGVTRYTFKATGEMAPNVYAHVSLVQPHAQTKNDLPMRLYGVIPVAVEDPATHLKPVIGMAEALRPNEKFSVQVSEASGKPMTYTLAVVDEGLLNITRYKTPDPWNVFYQREALNVRTWDLYDQVLGAYGGQIKSMLSIGGSEDALAPGAKKADRFRPVVLFLGPFELKPGQTATHALEMPNYMGAVRAMVVAGRPDGAYGAAEKSAEVKQPLMVLGTLPRVLGPGERARVPVSVFTASDALKSVEVSLEAGGLLLPEGPAKQSLSFSASGEKTISFAVGTAAALGTATVKIVARSGSETAVYETDIEVRNPNPRVTDVYAQNLEAGKNWSASYRLPGMSGTNSGVLEVAAVPPLNLGRRLSYLIRYPYGCLEQVTSSAFPQIYLPALTQLSERQKAKSDSAVRMSLNRLRAFQTSGGLFYYWPGGAISEWGTNYAGHFMLEAQRVGYSLPAGMLDKWKQGQRTAARDYRPTGKYDYERRWENETQAYRLYLLALAGENDAGAMNRLRQQSDLNQIAKWMLAGAYHLAGQRDAARSLIAGLNSDVVDYSDLGSTFGSTLRDLGIILDVLTLMEERERAAAVVQRISDRLASESWYNTHAIAYSLSAVARYTGRTPARNEMKFSWRVNGGNWTEVSTAAPIWQMDFVPRSGGVVEVRNQGQTLLFPRAVLEGIPLKGDSTEITQKLTMSVSYLTLSGQALDPARLEQGSDFLAKVQVSNLSERMLDNLALNQVFPSGWEIRNIRLDNAEQKGDVPDYQDIRDDRVYTFYRLAPVGSDGSSKVFYVYLTAAYPGRYYLPAVVSEAMYDHSIQARRKGRWVEVLPEGSR